MIILKDVYDIRTHLKGEKSKQFPITQVYGWTEFALDMWDRYLETDKKLYKYGIHTGLDIGIKLKLLKSPINGIVVVDDDANDSGRGIALSIWDPKQLIAVRLYHLKENFLYEGQEVFAGQDIAISGKTAGELTIGNKYHLHFEVITTDEEAIAIGEYGGAIDPLDEKLFEYLPYAA